MNMESDKSSLMRIVREFHRMYSSRPTCDLRRRQYEEVVSNPDWLSIAIDEIARNCYTPRGTREFAIPKKDGTMRKIASAHPLDRLVSMLLLHDCAPVLEQQQIPSVNLTSAVRRSGSISNVAQIIRQHVQTRKLLWASIDIRDFYNSVRLHDLRPQLSSLISDPRRVDLILSLASSQEGEELPCSDDFGSSVPVRSLQQGLTLVPLLADLYVRPLDEIALSCPCSVFRYVDDLLIVSSSKQAAEETMTALLSGISRLGLETANNKLVAPRDPPVEYLGFEVFPSGKIGISQKKLRCLPDCLAKRYGQEPRTRDKLRSALLRSLAGFLQAYSFCEMSPGQISEIVKTYALVFAKIAPGGSIRFKFDEFARAADLLLVAQGTNRSH